MRSVNDVEAYLGKMNRRYSPVDDQPGTFLVHGGTNMPPTALRVDPPLVVLRVHVGDVEDNEENSDLFRKLLTLNAKSLIHTSFGLEEKRIVLVAALELENLDYNELEATLDEVDVTLAQQVPNLVELSKAASMPPSAPKSTRKES
ncbi:MAG: CesT family type III secretion system chaperone [Labilithrix sp.]|nr:CesT family type III secretion system chaperone [Labilithrix sp.]MCW5818081.1 CesT family type III secretion system chaperone [Labilithrix sp.]